MGKVNLPISHVDTHLFGEGGGRIPPSSKPGNSPTVLSLEHTSFEESPVVRCSVSPFCMSVFPQGSLRKDMTPTGHLYHLKPLFLDRTCAYVGSFSVKQTFRKL